MERGSERQRCQTLVKSNKRTDLGKKEEVSDYFWGRNCPRVTSYSPKGYKGNEDDVVELLKHGMYFA